MLLVISILPDKAALAARLQVGLAGWASLGCLFFLLACQQGTCTGGWDEEACAPAMSCMFKHLGVYGWGECDVDGTEVRTWANRSEVVSGTTEQIFACKALRQITERQPAWGGGVRRRQGAACLLSSAEDGNAKPRCPRPLRQWQKVKDRSREGTCAQMPSQHCSGMRSYSQAAAGVPRKGSFPLQTSTRLQVVPAAAGTWWAWSRPGLQPYPALGRRPCV